MGSPHFVQGISGNWFQSPFAKPPGVGESSPVINVVWGFGNLAAGAVLLRVLLAGCMGGVVRGGCGGFVAGGADGGAFW